MKPLIIKSLLGEEIPRAPVWLMRQAGRYLKEYNAIKEKYTFLEMCKNPEIAFEVSMQPMRFFGPDAAIVFADILLPAESIGIEIDFAPGPKIKNPIDSSFSTKSLKFKDIQLSQKHVFETISLLKKELSQGEEPKAVIGFAGAPWTMACYLVNQKNFKNFSGTSIFAKQNKKVFHEFMEVLTNLTIEYVLAQIESGADMIQLFDTWAINLDQNDYSEFSLPYVEKIIQAINSKGVPSVLYLSGSNYLLEQAKSANASCYSIDWRMSLSDAEKVLGDDIAIQGNFDPTSLFLETSQVEFKTEKMLTSLKRRSRYIANLGHGILPTTPRENVAAFISTVQTKW